MLAIISAKLNIRNQYSFFHLCAQLFIFLRTSRNYGHYVPSQKTELISPSDFLSTFQITSELQMSYVLQVSVPEEDVLFLHFTD